MQPQFLKHIKTAMWREICVRPLEDILAYWCNKGQNKHSNGEINLCSKIDNVNLIHQIGRLQIFNSF